MTSTLEHIADGYTHIEHCKTALEPVVRRLLADKMPAGAIIAALAALTVLAIENQPRH